MQVSYYFLKSLKNGQKTQKQHVNFVTWRIFGIINYSTSIRAERLRDINQNEKKIKFYFSSLFSIKRKSPAITNWRTQDPVRYNDFLLIVLVPQTAYPFP